MDKQKAAAIRELINKVAALQKEFRDLTGQNMEVSGNVSQVASYVQGFLDATKDQATPAMEVIEPVKE